VVFGGNQNAAFAQMFAGKVRAVGSNSQLIKGYTARENKVFRVLWSSEGYHDLALMASGKVPEKDLNAVANAFYSMHADPRGKDILHQASLSVGFEEDARFIPATAADYANYRKFYQNAPLALR